MVWVQKYTPKNLKEFVDQQKAVETFLKWIKGWKPGRKALLLHGMPGVGKTALLQAYANENNLDFIELNASDCRSAVKIKEVLGQSMHQQSLFKRGKIFLLDEIDGIAGNEDKGGVGEIIKIVKESHWPIVLTANNPWNPKLRYLRNYCILVSFRRISIWDIIKRLESICEKEKIRISREVLKQIASMSEGDLRAAINDLETLCRGKKEVTMKDLDVLGFREKESSVFDCIKVIFKTNMALAAKLSINTVDKDPGEIFWWIEQNVSNEYEDPSEIAKAYDMLSRADIFRSRISSRQNWTFKKYMIDLMTGGVAVSKRKMYKKFTRYQYPDRIRKLGMSKNKRNAVDDILKLFSVRLHCSVSVIRSEYLPYLKIFIKKREFKRSIVENLGLQSDQIKLLLS